MKFTIGRLRSGELVLGCRGIGMEETLVFAAGAMVYDDPLMAKQREIMEYIVEAAEVYEIYKRIAQVILEAGKEAPIS
jgi:hypothetical protein